MKLEPANIVCPACGSGNYMRHLIGKNVGYLDMKCINCNSYFNFDELYKRRIGEVLEQKPITNGDRIRSKSDEELAEFYCNDVDACPPGRDMKCIDELYAHGEGPYPSDKRCMECWLDWLKQEPKP